MGTKPDRMSTVSRAAINKFGHGLIDLLGDLRDAQGYHYVVPVMGDHQVEVIALAAINQAHGHSVYCVPEDVSFMGPRRDGHSND